MLSCACAAVTSAEALKAYVGAYLTAFPDLTLSTDDLLAEGDKVVWRFTSNGTQTGPLGAIPATGKTGIVTGMVSRKTCPWLSIEIARICGCVANSGRREGDILDKCAGHSCEALPMGTVARSAGSRDQ